jgi:hypothetical protein
MVATYEISPAERMTRLSSVTINPGMTRDEIENRFFDD